MAPERSREYRVKARARNGDVIESTVLAANEHDAAHRLITQGLTVVAVTGGGTGLNRNVTFGSKQIKPKQLALVARQFATMLTAGLPIIRILDILSAQQDNPRLRDALHDTKTRVESGEELSEAMNAVGEFPPVMIAMIRAGEAGGVIDQSMAEIADSLESESKLRSKIKSMLAYPIAVSLIAILVVVIMLIFVVPIFSNMFASLGGELPAPTQMLVTLSNILRNPLFVIPAAAAIAVPTIAYKRNKNHPQVRALVDPLKFRIPVVGQLIKKISLARFTRNFSTLMSAGVPILTALEVVGETANNIVITNAVNQVKAAVRDGGGIAQPLAQTDVFPDMVVQMIAVGEATGALDQMLKKVADYYDVEVEASTEALMSLIEPVMILTLGILAAGLLVSLYAPIISVFELIQ